MVGGIGLFLFGVIPNAYGPGRAGRSNKAKSAVAASRMPYPKNTTQLQPRRVLLAQTFQ